MGGHLKSTEGGGNKQQNKCSFTTNSLKAHGGLGGLEVVRIFMSAVSEVMLMTQVCLLIRRSLIVQMKCRRVIWSHIRAVKKSFQCALRYSENYNQL